MKKYKTLKPFIAPHNSDLGRGYIQFRPEWEDEQINPEDYLTEYIDFLIQDGYIEEVKEPIQFDIGKIERFVLVDEEDGKWIDKTKVAMEFNLQDNGKTLKVILKNL